MDLPQLFSGGSRISQTLRSIIHRSRANRIGFLVTLSNVRNCSRRGIVFLVCSIHKRFVAVAKNVGGNTMMAIPADLNVHSGEQRNVR